MSLNTEVSLFGGCPLRGVPLYLLNSRYMSLDISRHSVYTHVYISKVSGRLNSSTSLLGPGLVF